MRIVMESGLANAAYLFVFVMTLEFGSQALEIMSEMVCLCSPCNYICPARADVVFLQAVPLTGIIFSIVILRVGHQRHGDSFYASQPAPSNVAWPRAKSTIGPAGGRTGTSATTTAGNTGSIPMDIFVHNATSTTKGYDDDSIQRLESRSLPDLPAAF